MSRLALVAFGSLALVAAGMAGADKLGSKTESLSAPGKIEKREMPTNDDFQSITFRAGAGGSSPTCCPADLDCDGDVDAADLAQLLGSWGACAGCSADINANGNVDASDLALMLGSWGPCAG